MDAPTPEQLAIIVGLATSFVVWLAKVLCSKYDLAPTLYKLVPAILLPALTVGFAAQWAGGWELIWRMALAIITSLGAYGLVGRQALQSIREDRWAKEDAAAIAAAADEDSGA